MWGWNFFTCKRYGSWIGLFGNAWFLACGFRVDLRAWLWVLTSFVPSPLKIPVCHESKSHTKWLLSVSRKERVWWNRATTTCDLTHKRLVYPLHRDLVHSLRRYESAWFVIAGDMPFPCLCRCKMQSFRNDARRETHNEVCLFCRGFRHVICPIITFIISFQREKVLEMFHHAYNSYMVSKLLSQRFAHKQ